MQAEKLRSKKEKTLSHTKVYVYNSEVAQAPIGIQPLLIQNMYEKAKISDIHRIYKHYSPHNIMQENFTRG